MALRPLSRGLSRYRREPVRGAAAKMGLPWNAYYVLTKAEARLTSSKVHPNSGAPDYNILHLHEDMNETNWSEVEEHDARYFTQTEMLELIAGAAFSFYPSDTEDGTIANYNKMFDADTGEAETSIAVEITADDTLIKAFITETGQPTFVDLAAGEYVAHVHLSATTAGRKDTRVYWTLSKRASGGAETLLITSEESNVLTNSSTAYEIHGILATDQTILSDDRLVLKIYGNQDSAEGADATATFYMEGTTGTRITTQLHFSAFDNRYLFLDGSNANTPLNIGSQNFTTTGNATANEFIGKGIAPIGVGFPYFKSAVNTSLPDYIVEMNGQTIDITPAFVGGDWDNGNDTMTVPNLNASGGGTKRFLRGSTTSGSVAPGAHKHGFTASALSSDCQFRVAFCGAGTLVSKVCHAHCLSNSQTACATSTPPYFEVVWVVRIE